MEFAMEGVYQTTEKIKLMARKKEPLEIVVNKSLRRVKKIWIKDFEGEIILETKISKVVLVYRRNGLKLLSKKRYFQFSSFLRTSDSHFQRFKDPFAKMPFMKILRFFMSFVKKEE